jgi:hypothetical protein
MGKIIASYFDPISKKRVDVVMEKGTVIPKTQIVSDRVAGGNSFGTAGNPMPTVKPQQAPFKDTYPQKPLSRTNPGKL